MWRVVLLAIWTSASAARAQSFFSSSPGALSKSHASLDSQARCNDCHVNGTRAVSAKQCLDCHDHKDLAQRITDGKGLHASDLVKGKPCEVCHDEHQGREFDLMGWSAIKGGKQRFDHAITGWRLNGKHASTPCDGCHTTTNKQGLVVYMGTDRSCGAAGCHLNDQPHKLARVELLDCARCHTESVWRPKKSPMLFDHDVRRDAGMPLLGKHAPVECAKCHPNDVYNLPFARPAACGNSGCHEPKHPPNHLFDLRDCEWCHSPTFPDFKQATANQMPRFDHTTYTRFELGGHARLRCYDCHTAQLGARKPVAKCELCHAKDNRHGSRFAAFGSPPRCNTCHATTGWKQNRFDHDRQTKFPLAAKHAQTACRGCHRGSGPADFENFKGVTTCKECHQHAMAHASPKSPQGPWKSNQCLKCHPRGGDKTMRDKAELEREWHGASSDFPLLKRHRGLDCSKCHSNRTPARTSGRRTTTFDEESPECGDRCHEDSLHRGSLGKLCTPCHVSGQWAALTFDHDVKTFPDGTPGYALKGEHKNNTCEACHGAARQFKGTPRACAAVGCHADDDAHKGRLGTSCEKCHTETGDNLFNHNTMSAFRLDGKHLQVRCTDCHPSVTFKPRPKTCFGCHPEPAVHKGQYGTACEQCHTTRTWEDIRPLHDVGDFSLRGMHNSIACERCHRSMSALLADGSSGARSTWRPLAGSGNLCINCHRQDDIHGNSLSPKCGDCHTQWSFAPARFDHSRVGCNLTALHRTLACFDCHRNGNFAGITAECVGCHRDDAVRYAASRPPDPMGPDPHASYLSCAGCHNAVTWSPARSGGARETICL